MGPNTYSDTIEPLFYKDGEHIPDTIIALGLAGETAEVAALISEYASRVAEGSFTEVDALEFAKLLKLELGDVMWYVAALLNSYEHDCSDIDRGLEEHPEIEQLMTQLASFEPPRLIQDLQMFAGLICDSVKKEAWHGKELDFEIVLAQLCNIAVIISEIAVRNGFDLGEICDANVEKLAKRYPGLKFVEGGGVR